MKSNQPSTKGLPPMMCAADNFQCQTYAEMVKHMTEEHGDTINTYATDSQTAHVDTEDQLDTILFKFADYIRHHERTGLGGSNHQGATKAALKQLLATECNKARIEEADLGWHHQKHIEETGVSKWFVDRKEALQKEISNE